MHRANWRREWPLLLLILLATFLLFHQFDAVPPGLHHDEAVNGLDALNLLRTGKPAPFYPANFGREPLHIYLQALSLYLLGEQPWALRVPSALAALVSIPLLFRLASALANGKFTNGKRGDATVNALLAVAVLVGAFPFLFVGRLAFRTMLMLPLILLGVWLFWRGQRVRRLSLFAGSGFALGLAMYTYLPARIMPLVLVIFAAWLAVSKRHRFRFITRGTLLMLGVTALVSVPLLLYFLLNPAALSERTGQVSIFAIAELANAPWQQLLFDNIVGALRMFVDQGYATANLNLPLRPALNPLAALAFWIGLAIALWRWRKPAHFLLLVWFALLLLPGVLADELAHPLRTLGALPPVVMLAGLGLGGVWRRGQRIQVLRSSWVWTAFLLLVTLTGVIPTYRDYFQRWAILPEHQYVYNLTEATAGRLLRALPAGSSAWLPANLYAHPSTQFFLQSPYGPATESDQLVPGERADWLYRPGKCRLQEEMVLYQPQAESAAAKRTHFTYELDLVRWLQPPAASRGSPMDDPAAPLRVLSDVQLPLADTPGDVQAAAINFDHRLCLVGFAQTSDPAEQSPATAMLYLERTGSDNGSLTLEIWPENRDGEQIAEVQRWQISDLETGEVALYPYQLDLPLGLAPGKILLQARVTNSDGSGADYLPVVDRYGLPSAMSATAGTITLAPLTPEHVTLNQPIGALIGDPGQIRLQGAFIPEATAPGEIAQLWLYWQTLSPPQGNYSLFIHLLDESGELLAQYDGEPMAPTSWWVPGESLTTPHALSVPADLAPGSYDVALGVYDWRTGERQPLFSETGERLVDDRLLLSGILNVKQPEE